MLSEYIPIVLGSSLVSSLLTVFTSKAMSRAKIKQVEGETEGQGIKNLDEVLELNYREIKRIEERFTAQLQPLQLIIKEQTIIINSQRLYIIKIDGQIKMYEEKHKELGLD